MTLLSSVLVFSTALLGFTSAAVAPPAAASSSSSSSSQTCKIVQGAAHWPQTIDWAVLNGSVGGRLISAYAPGAVCHPGQAAYNAQQCPTVATEWTNSSFHANNPFSVDYNDDTCFPNASQPCSTAGYPAYAIAAVNASDVIAGVQFAAKSGVRLIVKGTGHDFPGRSSGRGSLSIWTHGIKGIQINVTKDTNLYGTAKIAAGHTVLDILQAAAAQDVTIVTGSDMGVGIGGWLTGGGHGPLSGKYGLGADNCLSMEVVTANGTQLTIDPNNHSDLFYAMRGGGGSTFAVMLSATVRVFPNQATTNLLFTFNTTGNSDTYWNLTTLWHYYIPTMVDAGAMGYYYAYPLDPNTADPSAKGKFYGELIFPGKTVAQATAILQPFVDAVTKGSVSGLLKGITNTAGPLPPLGGGSGGFAFTDKVYALFYPQTFSSFSSGWQAVGYEAVGEDGRIASRLLDRYALTNDVAALSSALRQSTNPPWILYGLMVSGPGVWNASIPGGSNAVNPIWREAYVHIVLPRQLPSFLTAQNRAYVLSQLQNTDIVGLNNLDPNPNNQGCYLNEADPTEPRWKQLFWGTATYNKLAAIKDTWDPKGVFWCIPCVGHDEWTVAGGDAIGQDPGTICKAS